MILITKIRPKAPSSCASCGAIRKEPWSSMSPAMMYQMDIGVRTTHPHSFLLCQSCIGRLKDAMSRKKNAVPVNGWVPDFIHENWPGALSGAPSKAMAQLERFYACLDQLSHAGREVLYRFYTGEWLEIPFLPMDEAERLRKDGKAQEKAFNGAIAFLNDPVRKAFILTGRSDLNAEFSEGAVTYLNEYGAYVLSDMIRFDLDAALVLTDAGAVSEKARKAATPDTIQEIRDWLEKHGTR